MAADSAYPLRPLSNGLKVIHANRMEDLRDLVVNLLRLQPLDPLERDCFLVQSNGIAQWLKLAVAEDPATDAEGGVAGGGCGIAAGIDFLLPSRFVWQVYRAVLGAEAVPPQSPLDKEGLTWRLMRVLPDVSPQPGFEPLARFLSGAQQDQKLFQLASQVADLFDQYQVYRADWLAGWAKGNFSIMDARGQIHELTEDQRWQPLLWRALLDDLGDAALAATSRAAVHERFIHKLKGQHGQSLLLPPADLPRRVVIFGVSSLPRQTLQVLQAIASWSQVLLCVLNPCEFYWADIVADKDLLRAQHRRGKRKAGLPEQMDEASVLQHANPLLAAWGKQGRDYIRMLDEVDETQQYQQEFSRIDLFDTREGGCLLHQIQDDIRTLCPLHESRQRWPEPEAGGDGSVALHSAHSPQREVEVLQDQLLAAFSAYPDLRPRDIIVMVPDINAYAPHIQAVFGRIDEDDPRYIPFTISDQGSRHREPLLIALEHLLHLPEARLGAGDVLDLLDLPIVRARFGIDSKELPLLHRWIEGANIRWGLDAAHRESLDLPSGLNQHTWDFGLQRMLLGYASGGDCQWQGIEPYDEVAGLEAASAGKLAALLVALRTTRERLQSRYDAAEWVREIRALIQRFLQPEDADARLMAGRLDDTLECWLATCELARLEDLLPLSVVREVCLGVGAEGGLAQRFLVGKVNFATLLPMRAVPFRWVCLLGMNDKAYPRSRPALDFDLMAKDYRPGDRSRREDDRYLFLEALLSARDQLYISWVGRSIRENAECPPSVLVSQLMDYLDARSPGKRRASAGLLTEHPLQPFSRRYFVEDPAITGLFTYAAEWCEAHRAEPCDRRQTNALPIWVPEDPLDFTQLSRFLKLPAETFFRQRLRVVLARDEDDQDDQEPFSLSGLDAWKIRDELIRERVRRPREEPSFEDGIREHFERIRRRGDLGVGPIVSRSSRALSDGLAEMRQHYLQVCHAFPEVCPDQTIRLAYSVSGQTVILEDWLQDLRQNSAGQRLRIAFCTSHTTVMASSSKRKGWKHLLPAWVAHLCANAMGLTLRSCVITPSERLAIKVLAKEDAERILHQVVDAWVEGLSTPLAIEPDLAFAWIVKGGLGLLPEWSEAALMTLREAYQGSYYNVESVLARHPALQRAFPHWEDFFDREKFAQWAEQLYAPLVDAVEIMT